MPIEFQTDAGKSAPPRRPAACTTSNSTTYNPAARAYYCGTSGDIKFGLVGGTTVTLKNVAAGVWHGLEGIEMVYATGTTATDIVLGY